MDFTPRCSEAMHRERVQPAGLRSRARATQEPPVQHPRKLRRETAWTRLDQALRATDLLLNDRRLPRPCARHGRRAAGAGAPRTPGDVVSLPPAGGKVPDTLSPDDARACANSCARFPCIAEQAASQLAAGGGDQSGTARRIALLRQRGAQPQPLILRAKSQPLRHKPPGAALPRGRDEPCRPRCISVYICATSPPRPSPARILSCAIRAVAVLSGEPPLE